ncbi:DUF2306 domain-containing protein [Rhizobium sp. BR 314]|uniref:DUF2306 domain-containing protein n=1 Tax=Rhizobium sp. BR 314 TaxID=3040013 RepID=UPI0039BEFF49
MLAVAVAAYSSRYYGVLENAWFGIDPKIKAVILQAPLPALLHMLIAPVALALGPFQFYPGLRIRHPKLHRWSGRVYVATCIVGGVGALATAPFASGGVIAGLGFGLLAVLWIGTTAAAWISAVRRSFARHRLLMRFSYAMTFGAVVLRLQIPIGFALGYESYSSMSPVLAFTSWIPNVVIVALYSTWQTWRRSRPGKLNASSAASEPNVVNR